MRIDFHTDRYDGFGLYGIVLDELTREHFTANLPKCIVRSFNPSAWWSGYDIQLELDRRPPHAMTLDEIGDVLQRVGFYIGEAVIQETATAALEHLLGGGIASGVAGAVTKDKGLSLLLAALGGVAGYAHGSQEERVVATYHARRVHLFGGWAIMPVSPEPNGGN